MMLAQQVPRLIRAVSKNSDWVPTHEYGDLSGAGILDEVVNNRQYDASAIQDAADEIFKQHAGDPYYSYDMAANKALTNVAKDILGPSGATFGNPEFPSDWADTDDVINLAERKLENPHIVEASAPALESAANMYNNGLALGPSPVPSNTPPTWTSFLDSDLDDIHSSEMWEAGNQFNPKLRAWYLKNRR